jgi:HSP20 family protein
MLTIKGTVSRDEKEEDGDYYRREIMHGSYSRQVSLPASVDGSKIDAKLRDGVLEVTIPKKQGSVRRTIEVQ